VGNSFVNKMQMRYDGERYAFVNLVVNLPYGDPEIVYVEYSMYYILGFRRLRSTYYKQLFVCGCVSKM